MFFLTIFRPKTIGGQKNILNFKGEGKTKTIFAFVEYLDKRKFKDEKYSVTNWSANYGSTLTILLIVFHAIWVDFQSD